MKKNNAKIAIDLRLWSHPGIGRYTRELVSALMTLREPENFHFLGYLEDLQLMRDQAASLASNCPVTSKIYSAAEQIEILLKARNFKLLHVPHFNIPVLRSGRMVATVHDLTYLHDAKASRSRWGRPYAEFLFRRIQQSASAVIAVSEYTKNDFLNQFPKMKPERIFVTHEAASPLFRVIDRADSLDAVRTKYAISKPFVLFVGSLKEHKNIPLLIQAVERLRSQKKLDVELLVAGRRDFKNKALWEHIQEKAVFVKYLGEVPDEELAALYNLARVFVLPSLREGFGLPVLEAMACGTAVIVSNRTSLPEIAGSAGLVFDAGCVDELEGLLYNVLTDESLRQSLSSKGLARAAEFSWKKTAGKTLEIYDKVMR